MPSSHRTIRMIAMVSNMSVLLLVSKTSSVESKCNLSAVLCCSVSIFLSGVLLAILPIRAAAQTGSTGEMLHAPQPDEHRASDTVKFLAGAALGLGLHEGGHLVFDVIFDAKPTVAGVR